uniref:Uncharacterized protein n=1 Tax=Romanomermis culicivorax TaxID=13658 RepID=A0A915KX73_ROMCU
THASVYRKKDNIPSSLILSQTEKALLKQASEKLTLAELQHLQELLKTQFQETASQLACRTGRVPPLLTDVAQQDLTTPAYSPSRLAKNISIEALTDASLCMRQWYEEVQKVLEQKDVKVKSKTQKPITTAHAVKNLKMDPNRADSNLNRETDKILLSSNEQSSQSSASQLKPSCAFSSKTVLTLSNNSTASHPPVLQPAADPAQTTTLQQHLMSFQFLSSLSPSQLQFLQQQFNLAAMSHLCQAQQLRKWGHVYIMYFC